MTEPVTGVPDAALEAAAAALRQGQVVAVPTDTVYGLAVDASQPKATDALFAVKGRPASLALPVLVADVAQADALAGPDGLPDSARRLAARFWPGAVTLVVARRAGLSWDLGGEPDTIGLRCPASPQARWLCEAVGPLATTSANRHGRPPLNTAAEVRAVFPELAVVVDGGTCQAPPSTVVDVRGEPLLLREGAVGWESVLAAAESAP